MKNLDDPILGDTGYPVMKLYDEWLIRVNNEGTLRRITVVAVSLKAVKMSGDSIGGSYINEAWFRITDVEWIEKM